MMEYRNYNFTANILSSYLWQGNWWLITAYHSFLSIRSKIGTIVGFGVRVRVFSDRPSPPIGGKNKITNQSE